MENTESNKIIAEFMDVPKCRAEEHKDFPCYYINGRYYEKNNYAEMQYDKSWDWLMSVVEKIHKNGKMVNINFYSEGDFPVETKIYNCGVGEPEQEYECGSAIESVYRAVVEHIKWHNENKTK